MTEKTLASPKPSEIPIANNFKKVFRQYGGILSGMVVLIILFSFINDSFFTANNITNIILQVSIIAITAYGMTYVLLLGDIDLSVGSTIALIGTFAALGASWGIPFILLVPLSIIAALALGNGEFLYIPIPIWILIILLLINHFILTKTTFGRKIYITGGNKEAAIYSGINVTRLKIKVFMITAVLAGISGMILASRLYSGQPNSALSYELDAIAAAVLGGTSLNGGYGTVVGTVIGALTIGVINNGMNLMNVPYFYQMVVKGLVILVAVYFDVRNKRKRS
ncbi:ABC transporter permease [Escherichia coli]|uniref:ABC transporter permease n=1 Tax=Escherichia coli TaxID=562 RepID=UPI000EFFF798|nr:ABC transporter permease [Escherichia coli]EFJ5512238.1 ABC transporter permease [Escherichia coli]EHH5354133.1 ABC transporter permease [Escherichia coli]EHP9813165.1 ABC transporter permease [Escherichia coli]EHP9978679.1 ABC transporter permease [Escherichia coli]EHW0877235.1 ABC transporter permease [Escherichia coli]